VCLKVEQDKVFVRVGGGFIRIEDFVEQYWPPELERMEKSESQMKV
jgi:hypothetical protein